MALWEEASSDGEGDAEQEEEAPPAKKRVRPPRVVGGGYSTIQAKQWAPEGFRIWKDTSDTRWRLESKALPSMRQKAFGGDSGYSDYSAMVYVIKLAWARHTLLTNQACPFEFETEG